MDECKPLPEGHYMLCDSSGPDFQCLSRKQTPLIVAAGNGHTEIVRMLLERAPNTAADYADASGATALHLVPMGNVEKSEHCAQIFGTLWRLKNSIQEASKSLRSRVSKTFLRLKFQNRQF